MEGAKREGGTQDTEEGVTDRGWPGEVGRKRPQSLGWLCQQETGLGLGAGDLFFPVPLKVIPVMGISSRVHSNMWHLSGAYLWPGSEETLPGRYN